MGWYYTVRVRSIRMLCAMTPDAAPKGTTVCREVCVCEMLPFLTVPGPFPGRSEPFWTVLAKVGAMPYGMVLHSPCTQHTHAVCYDARYGSQRDHSVP